MIPRPVLRPCIDCGTPTLTPRCPAHTKPDTRPSAHTRGYDAAWQKLSTKARAMQPWCSDCHTTEDLTVDHSAHAWARKAAGKRIRLTDVEVVCRPCNSRRGAARGPAATPGPQGGTPLDGGARPPEEFDFRTHSGDAPGKGLQNLRTPGAQPSGGV